MRNNNRPWYERSIAEHAEALRRGEYSSTELTRAYLARIAEIDGAIGAYLTVTEEAALSAARRSDERRARGESLGELEGIPYGLKDNLCTEGIPTTCASRMLAGYLPPYDATVRERLDSLGGVLLGKLNMDEFGMGSSTEHSAYGPTRNPRDLRRVAGGSSGGSAAAVAAHLAAYTLGSDTGGSVRQPSAFCGTVGMKPTYGRVSRYGLVAFASSLEQIGPITSTVRDNATVLTALAGRDPRDAQTAFATAEDFAAELGEGVRGLRVGVPTELLGEEISPHVRRSVQDAVCRLRQMGAVVREISLPALKEALAVYYVISSAEASSNLARFDGIRYGVRTENVSSLEELYRRSRSEGFGAEVKRRILLGTFVLAEGYSDAVYPKAMALRSRLRRELETLWSGLDLLLSPTAPTVAFPLGEGLEDPVARYRGDLCGVIANLTGIPALTLPAMPDPEGLPIGVQLMGDRGSERLLYRVADALMRSFESENG